MFSSQRSVFHGLFVSLFWSYYCRSSHSQPLNTMDFTSSMIVVKRALPSRATFLVHYAHDEEM